MGKGILLLIIFSSFQLLFPGTSYILRSKNLPATKITLAINLLWNLAMEKKLYQHYKRLNFDSLIYTGSVCLKCLGEVAIELITRRKTGFISDLGSPFTSIKSIKEISMIKTVASQTHFICGTLLLTLYLLLV